MTRCFAKQFSKRISDALEDKPVCSQKEMMSTLPVLLRMLSLTCALELLLYWLFDMMLIVDISFLLLCKEHIPCDFGRISKILFCSMFYGALHVLGNFDGFGQFYMFPCFIKSIRMSSYKLIFAFLTYSSYM